MKPVMLRTFVYSSGAILFLAASAKFISSLGSVRILQQIDPILDMPFRLVFIVVAIVEVIVGCFCFFGKRSTIQVFLIAWLATSFLVYRIGLIWVGYQKPCACLGNLTDALHISPQTADTAMKIVLAYLLIGSYASLFWLWRQGRNEEGRMKNEEEKPAGSSEMGVGT